MPAPLGQCGWLGSGLKVWVVVWQEPSLPPAIQEITFWQSTAGNSIAGKRKRHVSQALTGPNLHHVGASGSLGQNCGPSHRLKQVLFMFSHNQIFKKWQSIKKKERKKKN